MWNMVNVTGKYVSQEENEKWDFSYFLGIN